MRTYITAAIDYPNNFPHLGTAFEKIGVDVYARHRRMLEDNVVFLMGTDENTIRIAERANEIRIAPKDYCKNMAEVFKKTWCALNISFTEFVTTSSASHHACCVKFFNKILTHGHIRRGNYEGLYCNGCETFKTEKDLINGLCPDHNTMPQTRTEECYYFNLSSFTKRLLKFHEEHPDFIQPESRRSEIINIINSGLHDVNITRKNQNWGIPVPFDKDFTLYVWFDALLSYLTGVGYGTDGFLFEHMWPANTHFIGKDISRFHCILWPAMLMAAEISLPKRVFVHGFILHNKQKVSKTIGNSISPMEVINKFGSDALRYYLMKECPFTGDGEFSWQRFEEVYNSDLANNLGNLFSRVTTLIVRRHDKFLHASYNQNNYDEITNKVISYVEACEYHKALQTIWEFLSTTNRYIENMKPWNSEVLESEAVLRNCVSDIRTASILLKPFMPATSKKIYESFSFSKPWADIVECKLWENLTYKDACTYYEDDIRLLETYTLFPNTKQKIM